MLEDFIKLLFLSKSQKGSETSFLPSQIELKVSYKCLS